MMPPQHRADGITDWTRPFTSSSRHHPQGDCNSCMQANLYASIRVRSGEKASCVSGGHMAGRPRRPCAHPILLIAAQCADRACAGRLHANTNAIHGTIVFFHE
ncbi:hypothetical protein V8C35DRAFT_293945, partial [Trichoderma chlorosporum]